MTEYPIADVPLLFSYPLYFKQKVKEVYPTSKELQKLVDADDMEIPICLWGIDEQGLNEKELRERRQLYGDWSEHVEHYFESQGM